MSDNIEIALAELDDEQFDRFKLELSELAEQVSNLVGWPVGYYQADIIMTPNRIPLRLRAMLAIATEPNPLSMPFMIRILDGEFIEQSKDTSPEYWADMILEAIGKPGGRYEPPQDAYILTPEKVARGLLRDPEFVRIFAKLKPEHQVRMLYEATQQLAKNYEPFLEDNEPRPKIQELVAKALPLILKGLKSK